ncbi:hypothetical protein KC622_02625 [Candidatus Dojkabacteria bacterium]|uniref:Peptidase MA-like domain-containing protein n=1 Tax=Candidatus Dojkabacteria bacterium TaxID=2099670 RepID=A0A955HZI9_9BACT|nr:hypothetical protein [Candidatus Dojkabacteria bacterium]MCB9790546.1 hypothetical protein [Candidatus Nomurabacteria bacterium]
MKRNTKVAIGIIASLIFALQVYFVAAAAIAIYQRSQSPNNSSALEYESLVDNRHEYIDPEENASTEGLLKYADDRFYFEFSPEISYEDSINYQYEEDFILTNLASEYDRYARLFGEELPYKIRVLYFDNQADYEKATQQPYGYDIGYGGYTFAGEINIYMGSDLAYSKQDFFKLISHELFHAFQFRYYLAVITTPRWFDEGLADYFSDTKSASVRATLEDYPVDSLNDLDRLFNGDSLGKANAAYDLSNNFIAYLASQSSDKVIIDIIKNVTYSDFETQFYKEFEAYPEEVFHNWILNYMENYSSLGYKVGSYLPASNMIYIRFIV